jgi:hypothetical protein
MWNIKKKDLFLVICLTCSIVIFFTLVQSCTKKRKIVRTDFEFVRAEKYFLPPTEETVAILYGPDANGCDVCPDSLYYYYNVCYMLALFGDKKEAERIIGKELKPARLVKGREWLEKITDAYKIAIEDDQEKSVEKRDYSFNPNIVFITQDKGYIRGLNFRDKVVYDECMESALLKDYFEELGFIPHIRPSRADKYFVPPKDKTVAIFLFSSEYYMSRPVAIFGDKKVGEKLLYGDKKFLFGESHEPERVFEGRKWLEKIMDAYEVVLKQAKEDKKEKVYQRNGSIVFLTRDEGYIRGFDVGEDTIYDDVAESNLLKTYFDKLGITRKLLGGRSPMKAGKFKFVFPPAEYYVPSAGEPNKED